MMRVDLPAGLAALLGPLLCASALAAPPVRFTATRIDPPPAVGQFRVTAINDAGSLTGMSYDVAGYRSPVAWQAGRGWIALPLPDIVQGYGAATAISGRGWVTGYSDSADTAWQSMVWAPDGTAYDLGASFRHGASNLALAINDRGQVLGCQYVERGRWGGCNGYRWSRDTGMQPLVAVHNRPLSTPTALNAAGTAVGQSIDRFVRSRAAVWPLEGSPFLVPLPAGTEDGGVAAAINDAGMVTGYSNRLNRAFVWRPGQGTTLLESPFAIGSHVTITTGINAGGVVAGSIDCPNWKTGCGALWFPHGESWQLADINALIDWGQESGWHVVSADALNAAGQVVVSALQVDVPASPTTTFLLTPED